MNYNFATHANRLKACYSFFIKDIKYALTYLSDCSGEVDDFTRRGEGRNIEKWKGETEKTRKSLMMTMMRMLRRLSSLTGKVLCVRLPRERVT